MTTKPGKGTLSYTGIKESNPPQIYESQRDPTVNDFKRYDLGDLWINRLTKHIWALTDKAANVATWVELGDTTEDISTLTGDAGGAVGPDAADNVNLLGGVGLTMTGVPATNTLTMEVDPEAQIYYVGKHGNDTNNGQNVENAVLTFGQALTLTAAASPGPANKFVIFCPDAGIYTENITCQGYVEIWAPNATLEGTITCVDNSDIRFNYLDVPAGFVGVTKSAGGTTYSNVEIDTVVCNGNAIGFLGLSGALYCKWKEMYVEDGFGAGDLSSALDHMHIEGRDIYIDGTGTGIARSNPGTMVGYVDHIEEIGGASTGIAVLEGTIGVDINKIDCTAAYNVTGAAATLRLFCNEIIGTRTTAGGGTTKLWVPQDEMANGTLVIGAGTTSDPVVSTLTAGSGISITNGAGSITISSTGGFSWNEITVVAANMSVNNGYIANNAGLVTLTMPATAAIGDCVQVVGKGTGGWRIAQNAGQTIHFANNDTTAGAGGRLDSTGQYDTVELVCITANTDWAVIDSVGAITVT